MEFNDKAKLVGIELTRIFNETKPKLYLKEVAQLFGNIEVVDEGSSCDAPLVNINGLEYYDACDGDYEREYNTETIDEKQIEKLSDYFSNELSEFEDNWTEEEELPYEIKASFLCSLNDAIAGAFFTIVSKIDDEYSDNLTKKIAEIKVEGFVPSEEWGEIEVFFHIDGKRCKWNFWSDIIDVFKDEESFEIADEIFFETEKK